MIKTASTDNADEACAVVRESIQEICGPYYNEIPGYVEEWLSNKTPSNLRQWIEHGSNEFLVSVGDNGALNGVSCIGKNGEILLCYVRSEFLGSGIGKALMGSMKDIAVQWELTEIIVYSTVTAKDFYIAQGFEDTLEVEMKDGRVVEHKLRYALIPTMSGNNRSA